MTVFIAALLLSAALSPPPDDDDDQPRPARPAVGAPPTGESADQRKPAVSDAPGATTTADDDDDEEGRAQPASTIIVTAHRLDSARTRIDSALGASIYSLTNDTVENRPGGETGSVADILAQAPGVTLSGRKLNIRGAPANEVRINNVIVPEAITDPAEELSARLAETTRLIAGTLPAQFGFAPAGVISITTKNGLYQHEGQAEVFAGSDGMVEPALEWGGSLGPTSLFASGSLEHGWSSVADGSGTAARDRRQAVEGLGFADHVIDGENRLSLLFGGSHERNRYAARNVGLGTETTGDSFAVATFQHTDGGFTLQASVFGGLASDAAIFGDRTRERRSSFGTQIDASESIGPHVLRFGLLAARSTARDLQAEGSRSSEARPSLGLYAQDEWTILSNVTVNSGVRIEWLRGLGSDAIAEPRASLVWTPTGTLTAHLGYARYAAAPPLGEQPADARLHDERDSYFDGGLQQKLGALTIGLDGYFRRARDYLTAQQTIGSAVPVAFAFKRARFKGVELSAILAGGRRTAWANLSLAAATGRTLIGAPSLFPAATFAAAADFPVPLASDRPVTGSGGFTQRFGKFSLGGDILVSSGAVRTNVSNDPNGGRRPAYALFGVTALYHATIAGRPADIRLDLTNLGNAHYTTSDSTALEGGWTRRGRPRAITIGIEQGF